MSITNATTFLLLLLAFGSSNGHLDVNKLVQEKCTDKKHSFVVSLIKRVSMKPADFVASAICTGSLLTMGWVLTTASCLFKVLRTIGALRSYPNVSVIAGFDPTQEHFEERTMARFIPFNDKLFARKSQTDDLVLIELNKPFEPSPKVSLIKLARTDQAEKCKQGETVSTIPHIEMNGPRAGKSTVKVVCRGINLIKSGICSRFWSWLKSKSSLCGETRSKREVGSEESRCAGAEGSPLVCDGALIGLQSKCKRGGDMRSDAVQTSFLKLEPYKDFIANTIAELRNELNTENRRRKKKGMKATTDQPGSGEANFFDGALWKMVAGVCTVLMVYF